VDTKSNRGIEGFDFARRLRLFGNRESYPDVIHSFIIHTPAMLETFREPRPLPEYGAAAHSIKGAAYGICADSVGKKAERLKRAAKPGDGDFTGSHTASFIALTEKLIEEPGAFLKTIDGEQSKPKKPAPGKALPARVPEVCVHYDIDEFDNIVTELERYGYESQPDLIPLAGGARPQIGI
jgi:hypothetical protein